MIVLINFLCLILYLLLSSLFLFLLYFFRVLSNDTKVRYKFNFLDFYLDFLKMLSYDFQHRDPDAFKESGIVIYVGSQGSGKTISMVHDVLMLKHKYQKVKIMGNLAFSGSDQELTKPDDLLLFTNGIYGVITPIDELGVLFSARKFKDFPVEMCQVIFENRKSRRLLLGTVQKIHLMDKNLRCQVSMIKKCFTLFGCISGYIRQIPSFDSEGNIISTRFAGIHFFIQSNDLRNCYDTYEVIRKFSGN